MFEDFRDYLTSLLASPATIRGYLSDLKNSETSNIINIDLSLLDLDKLLVLPIKVTTKRRIRAAIRRYARFLVNRGIIKNYPNIIDTFELPRNVRSLPRVTTPAEVFSTIESTKDLEIKAILHILVDTGARISSIAGLKDEDIKEDHIVFLVAKGNKPYVSFLTPKTKVAIKEYQQKKTASVYLFPTRSGKQSTANSLRIKLTRALGDRYINPHSIRHSFATNLIDHNIDILTVQKLLNHSSIATTQRYIHNDSSKALSELQRIS